MSEENVNKEAPQPEQKQDTVQVSQEEVKQIEDKINTTDSEAVNKAVEAGQTIEKQSSEIKQLEEELAKIKAENDEIARKQEEEKKKQELLEEINKQRQYANQINQKHVVPQSANPTAPQPAPQPEPVEMSNSQKWNALENTFANGSSTLSNEEFLKGRAQAPPK